MLEIKEKTALNIFLIIIFAIPFASVLNMYIGGISYLKAIILILCGCTLFSLFAIKIYKKEIKFKIEHCLIMILLMFGIISTIFAINPTKAILGEENLYEGLLSILAYYGIFLSATTMKNPKYKYTLLSAISIVVIIQSLYAIGQKYALPHFINRLTSPRPFGFCENANMFGSLLVIGSGIIITTYLFEKSIKKSIVYLLGVMLIFIAAIYSGTRSTWIGIAVIYGLLTIIEIIRFLIYKQNRNSRLLFKRLFKIAIACTCCLAIFYSINYSEKNLYAKRIKDVANDVKQYQQTGEVSHTAGAGRVEIWVYSYNLLNKYWLTGCGIDCLKDELTHIMPIDSGEGIFYYKAHNEILQTAVTQGIFSAMSYIIFLCIILYRGVIAIIKTKGTPLVISFLVVFVGYIVQSFFNISVIEVAPYFWMICGLLCSDYV